MSHERQAYFVIASEDREIGRRMMEEISHAAFAISAKYRGKAELSIHQHDESVVAEMLRQDAISMADECDVSLMIHEDAPVIIEQTEDGVIYGLVQAWVNACIECDPEDE